MLNEIGIRATGPAAPLILNGTYTPPPGTDKATKQFLQACHRTNNQQTTTYDHFSFEHYCQAWSKAKEKTGSGTAHFGHWKAGTRDEEIAKTQWMLMTLPSRYGFSPKAWQRATDVMILKKRRYLRLGKVTNSGVI